MHEEWILTNTKVWNTRCWNWYLLFFL